MSLSPQVTKDLSKRAVDVMFDAVRRVTSLASGDDDAQAAIALAAASGAIGIAAGHLMIAALDPDDRPAPGLMLAYSHAVLDFIRASLEKDGPGALADVMKARPELASLFERAAAARS